MVPGGIRAPSPRDSISMAVTVSLQRALSNALDKGPLGNPSEPTGTAPRVSTGTVLPEINFAIESIYRLCV